MLTIVLIGLALSYHWPEPVAAIGHADAVENGPWPRPLGPLICTGDAAFRDANAPANKPETISGTLAAGFPSMGSNNQGEGPGAASCARSLSTDELCVKR